MSLSIGTKRWLGLAPGGGAASLALGTALGQGIALAATPILTRIYSPQDFGVLAVMAGLILTISAVSSLRCELVIPLPVRDGVALIVAATSFLILCAITLSLLILGLGPAQLLMGSAGMENAATYYLMLPIGVFFTGLYQLTSMWAIRRRSFNSLAVTRVSQGFGGALSQFVFGFLQLGALGLIFGQILGQALGVWGLAKNLIQEYRRRGRSIKRKDIKWAFQRCRDFIRFDTPAALLNTAGAHIPSILLAALLGGAVAGYYALSTRLLSAPVTLVGKTLSQAILPDLVAAKRELRLRAMVEESIRLLAAFSFVPFLLITIIAPVIFGPLLGQTWAPAAAIAQWSALWIALQFIYSPISAVLLVVEAQRANLLLQIGSFVARVMSIYATYLLWSTHYVVPMLSVITAISYLIGIAMVTSLSNGKAWGILFGLVGELMIALLVSAPLMLALKFEGNAWLLIVSLSGSVLLWGARLQFSVKRWRNSRKSQ